MFSMTKVMAVCLVCSAAMLQQGSAFRIAPRSGAAVQPRTAVSVRMAANGESTPTSAPSKSKSSSSSSALVTINKENVEAGVGLAGAAAGFIVFGNPVFALVLAAAANYGAKQDSEVGEAVRGVGTAIINTVNFAAKLNSQYTITDKVGTAAGNAFSDLKAKDTSDAQILSKVEDFVTKATTTVGDLDKEYNLKAKAKEAVYAAGDLSTQAIEKASDLNDKYKLTDQASDKVKEIVEKAKDATNKN